MFFHSRQFTPHNTSSSRDHSNAKFCVPRQTVIYWTHYWPLQSVCILTFAEKDHRWKVIIADLAHPKPNPFQSFPPKATTGKSTTLADSKPGSVNWGKNMSAVNQLRIFPTKNKCWCASLHSRERPLQEGPDDSKNTRNAHVISTNCRPFDFAMSHSMSTLL